MHGPGASSHLICIQAKPTNPAHSGYDLLAKIRCQPEYWVFIIEYISLRHHLGSYGPYRLYCSICGKEFVSGLHFPFYSLSILKFRNDCEALTVNFCMRASPLLAKAVDCTATAFSHDLIFVSCTILLIHIAYCISLRFWYVFVIYKFQKYGRIPLHSGYRWSATADVESLVWDPHSEHSFVVWYEPVKIFKVFSFQVERHLKGSSWTCSSWIWWKACVMFNYKSIEFFRCPLKMAALDDSRYEVQHLSRPPSHHQGLLFMHTIK